MARLKKSECEFLGERELISLIRKHPSVKAIQGLSYDQIRAVFSALHDIILSSILQDVRVSLPYIGQFVPTKQKGYRGGINYLTKEYIPPKGSHKGVSFSINKQFKDYIKDKTREELNLTDEEIEELKKKALGELNG